MPRKQCRKVWRTVFGILDLANLDLPLPHGLAPFRDHGLNHPPSTANPMHEEVSLSGAPFVLDFVSQTLRLRGIGVETRLHTFLAIVDVF